MIQKLDLNGTWKVHWVDGMRGGRYFATEENYDEMRFLSAQVPGEIHLDAWKAGWIKDPYVETNALAARWIEQGLWCYRHDFDVPEDASSSKHVWLNFEGLDYFATILLNRVVVGSHENSFYPCRLDVTGKLRPGKNQLVVHLEGGCIGTSDKPSIQCGDQERLTKRLWLRKPQCQFSWDWSTRFVNVGIFKSVTLEWSTDPVRMDQLVALATLDPDLQQGQVKVRWFAEGLGLDEVAGILKIEIPETGKSVQTEVKIKPGLHPLEAVIEVANPQLWWPVGHGKPNRYQVNVTLEINGAKIAEKETQIGFRHVVINQESHPEKGRFFIIEINGKKIFCKGGNFVPADMIFMRADRPRYETLIDRALEANFNLLRIWGGGLYEADEFYDLCDEKGVLVWQEFIFACGEYPVTDDALFGSVKNEAVYNIRRLASHPSLIFWCGNNEMEWGVWNNYDKRAVPDLSLFHITLPQLLKREDGTRYYQPSSPYSPDGQHPNADELGDQHPWSIGMRNTDFREYRKMICRFPNEGGILGPTSLPTLLACLPEGQRFPGSLAWQLHDNSINTWENPSLPDQNQIIRQWLGADYRKMSLEEFTYWAGLVQGEGLREYCENFRRRKYDSAAAIFWMFNDCWPTVRSWTIVDYYLRRTPSFHFVKRAFAPVSVVVVPENDEIKIYGINETFEPIQAQLRSGIFSLEGKYLEDASTEVKLEPNASTLLATLPMSLWTRQNDSMPFAILMQNGQLLARGRTFTLLFKEIRWPAAAVQVEVKNGKAVFQSDTFAWNVCIDLDGEENLADNFFDLFPGIPYVIPWTKTTPPKVLHVGNDLPKLVSRIPAKP